MPPTERAPVILTLDELATYSPEVRRRAERDRKISRRFWRAINSLRGLRIEQASPTALDRLRAYIARDL